MSKEWILNSATNRFQINFKRNVGATSEEIRKCQPKELKDWEDYYFSHVHSKEHLEELGKKLYVKVSEVLHKEISDITEEDCIAFVINLVIKRTFEGYQREIQTIYGALENRLNIKIFPAPDEWDRGYHVDFFIKIGEKYIGLQIKPYHPSLQLPQIHKERALQLEGHKRFQKKFGGRVFYIFSITNGKEKKIQNLEVVEEIKEEMRRLIKSS